MIQKNIANFQKISRILEKAHGNEKSKNNVIIWVKIAGLYLLGNILFWEVVVILNLYKFDIKVISN